MLRLLKNGGSILYVLRNCDFHKILGTFILTFHSCLKLPISIQPPEYMPENLSQYSAWVGGAILAKVVFPQNQHVTKADYDENGPSVVHRKCF